MESVWSVSKLSTESVGSRRELFANCVHIADADATKQFRRVGGVYWALGSSVGLCYNTAGRQRQSSRYMRSI